MFKNFDFKKLNIFKKKNKDTEIVENEEIKQPKENDIEKVKTENVQQVNLEETSKLEKNVKEKKSNIVNAFEFNTDTAVSIKDVHLHYGEFEALKGINMEIPLNEITAFIGPSGCGKSTLLKCINRMNDLVEGCKIEGTIKVGDRDIYAPDMSLSFLRKNVGMVFQKPNPFPMSIYDNITFAPKTFGIKNKKVLDEIVERSLRQAAMWDELKDRLNKSALGLSGGQQQRLCIARALSVGPQILLMDEPTSALDPISTGKIEELCEELKKEVTIVIVTHNMQQALRISNRTGFFLLGELVEYGNTDDIFSSPKKPETEKYITGRFG